MRIVRRIGGATVQNFIWCKTKSFLLSDFLISTFDITFAINLLLCYLFRKCFAMFLIFTFSSSTKKSLCGAHTSHLFSFFQEPAPAPLIRHTAPSYILLEKGEHYFQRWATLIEQKFKPIKINYVSHFLKISLKHHFFSFLQSTTPHPFLMKELPDIRHLYHLQSLWRKHLLNGEVSDLSYMTDVEKSKISLPPSCEISKFFTWQIWNNQVKSDFSP